VLSRLVDVPDQYVGGELLTAVYARLGMRVEFVDVEGKRALALSSSGQVDGEIQRIAEVAQTYPALLRVPTPINYIEPSVFTIAHDFKVQGWASIRDFDIGIVRGVGSSETGTAGMPKVQAANSLEDLIRMLDRGRFDLFVTDLFSGQVAVRKHGLEGRIRALVPPLQRIDIYHYLHRRHAALVPRVDAEIAALQASGELARRRAELVEQVLRDATSTR
jgi:ABC-type amino acid transport substrate-binding protein